MYVRDNQGNIVGQIEHLRDANGILLPELLRSFRDRESGLVGQAGSSFKAEQLAPAAARFDDAIGEECEAV